MDLEEILSRDKAHIRSKEAEVLATLTEFTGPARCQFEGAKRELGPAIPPQLLSVFIDPENQDLGRKTIKACTATLFDAYAEAASRYVIDAEPFISLLPAIAERVRLKLGTIDLDEAEVRKHTWESAAWAREKPTLLNRFFKWMFALLNDPAPKVDSVPLAAPKAPGPQVTMDDPVDADKGGGTTMEATVATAAPNCAVTAPADGGRADRSHLVDDFLVRCNREPGLTEKIGRKHIVAAVGHNNNRQFQCTF